jgi:hypothetical protein
MLSDIVKRRSIRKVVVVMSRGDPHPKAMLDRAPLGSVSKQAGLSETMLVSCGLKKSARRFIAEMNGH